MSATNQITIHNLSVGMRLITSCYARETPTDGMKRVEQVHIVAKIPRGPDGQIKLIEMTIPDDPRMYMGEVVRGTRNVYMTVNELLGKYRLAPSTEKTIATLK